MGKIATEYLEAYHNSIPEKLRDSFKKVFLSKSILNKYKKENNLNHVKGKIYFKGMELKTFA